MRRDNGVGVWRVIALHNEMNEEEIEITMMDERFFADYFEMRDYVSECEANGCIGGQVYIGKKDGRWEYYMEICQ